jgi:hypothetical protein
MKTDHIMIDIETLGTSVDSAIIAIGAIRFNMYPDPYQEIDKFYATVSLDSNLNLGRVITQSTLKWWVDTNVGLICEMLGSDNELHRALNGLTWFLDKSSYETIWANGTDFDIAMLKHAYKQCLGTEPPWKYYGVKDCRTVYKLYGHLVDRCDNGTAHNALDDCRNQAIYLDSVLRAVGERINNHEVGAPMYWDRHKKPKRIEKSCRTCVNDECVDPHFIHAAYSKHYCDDYKEQK